MESQILRQKKGYRSNMTSFHSVVADSYQLLKKWPQVLFEVQYMCVELDFVSTKVWNFMMQCQLRSNRPEGTATTGASALALDDKALRSTGANAVVICMLLLSNPSSRRLLGSIVIAGLAVQAWHEHSVRELRDVDRSRLWLVHQLTEGFADHLHSIWRVLDTPDGLRLAEFLLVSDAAHMALAEEEMLWDDEHSASLGSMVVNLLSLFG